jgi:hypothetical protein
VILRVFLLKPGRQIASIGVGNIERAFGPENVELIGHLTFTAALTINMCLPSFAPVTDIARDLLS